MTGSEPIRLERVDQALPAGFEGLLAESHSEGHRFLDRLARDWASRAMRFDRPGESLWAAFVEGELAGIGGVTQDPAIPDALRLRRFYVLAGHRGRGIGRALARRLIAAADAPLLTVNASAASVGFWERLGFASDARDGHSHIRRPVHIRPMTPADLGVARGLVEQLGYALSAAALERRVAAVRTAPGHVLVVGEQGGRVVGLMHFYARPALEKPPEAIVQALVVDAAVRGSGVGTALMRFAEGWAAEHGYHSVALASNVVRVEAHAFYERLGYRKAATSHLLRKPL